MNNLVFYCPQTEKLAKQVFDAGNIDPGAIKLGQITWDSFADGFPDYMIKNAHQIKTSDVSFLASFDSPADIFNQLSIIYALPRYLAKSLKIFLPYYPTGTMERIEVHGQIATAMTLARMLSATPITRTGPVQIIIFDIHALQEEFYFNDNVLVRRETAIPLIYTRCPKSQFAVAYPDDGAWKRFSHYFHGYEQIICQKVRDGEKRIITIKEGDPKGKKIILIDDLIQTGGTLREAAKKLLEFGAETVLAYCPHGVFPNESWKKFDGSVIKKVFITDSCPHTVAQVEGNKNFEILTLATLISDIITE